MKRVNFVVDYDDYRGLQVLAKSKGVTSSELIRRWISSIGEKLKTSERLSAKVTKCDLWLNEFDEDKLAILSESMGLRISTVLRSLVSTGVGDKSQGHGAVDDNLVERLWNSGELLLLQGVLERDFERLSFEKKLLLAKSLCETGDFVGARRVIGILKQDCTLRNGHTVGGGESALIEAEMLAIEGEYQTAMVIISKTLDIAKLTKDRYLLGKGNYLAGYIHSKMKSISIGMANIKQAIEFFDIIYYPYDLVKSYLFMTDFLEYEENYSEAEEYYNRAEEILSLTPNRYYLSWYCGGKAFNEYLKGNIAKSIEYSRRAMLLDKQTGSKKQLFYSTGVAGRSELVAGDYKKAFQYFSEAEEEEGRFRPRYGLSNNVLYKEFIRSKGNPDALDNLASIISENNLEGKEKSYIYYTSQFLFGKDDEVRSSGVNNLRNLAQVTPVKQIAKAIHTTIRERTIQPIAI